MNSPRAVERPGLSDTSCFAVHLHHRLRSPKPGQDLSKAVGNIPHLRASPVHTDHNDGRLDDSADNFDSQMASQPHQAPLQDKVPASHVRGKPPLYKNAVPRAPSPPASPTRRSPSSATSSAAREESLPGSPPLPHSVEEGETCLQEGGGGGVDGKSGAEPGLELAEGTLDFDVTLLPEVVTVQPDFSSGATSSAAKAAPANPKPTRPQPWPAFAF